MMEPSLLDYLILNRYILEKLEVEETLYNRLKTH